jgi:hypothetical protein
MPNTDNKGYKLPVFVPKAGQVITVFAFCSCYQDGFITGDKPGLRHCNAQNFYPVTNISFALNFYPCLRSASSGRSATLVMLNKICTRTTKTRAIRQLAERNLPLLPGRYKQSATIKVITLKTSAAK